jgi:A/G-specific adenine glycosylase
VPAAQRALLAWYSDHKRDLPWRADRDPYRVWISEAMLQQTRVETVLDYYERFMARFPTLAQLARAPIEEVLAAWSGLGYYRRARTLHAAARTIVAEHGASFPRDRAVLLALPGVGRYTAGAIASIAFDAREPLVDGNVARVFCRLFALDGDPSSAVLSTELWARALDMLPSAGSCGDWNQALMELGALVCTPRDPGCGECPLRAACRALAENRVSELPRAKEKPAMISVALAVMVIVDRDRWLLEQRPELGRMASMWQFPTIEFASETALDSSFSSVGDASSPNLRDASTPSSRGTGLTSSRSTSSRSTTASGASSPSRGLLHPTRWPDGVEIDVGARLGEIRHTITRHRIRATVHRARLVGAPSSSELVRREGVARERSFAWFTRRELDDLPLTGMARKVLRSRFLAILPAPEAARRAPSPRGSTSKNNAKD